MAQEADIERAYTNGRTAAERSAAMDSNPYSKNTEEWDACARAGSIGPIS